MSDKTILTREGYLRLMDKLIYLYNVVRPKLIEEMQEVRSNPKGTTSREYFEIRAKLLRLQKTIQDIEDKMNQSEILVGVVSYCKRAYIGALVELQNSENGLVSTYRLVGHHESDIQRGLLSVSSPLGSALIGHSEGDKVIVETPSGIKTYKILSIKW